MFKNAIEKGKTGSIVFLVGALVGIGLTLWLTRKRKKLVGVPSALPGAPIDVDPGYERPYDSSSFSGVGEHVGNPARYVTESLDEEVEDPEVDFDMAGDF